MRATTVAILAMGGEGGGVLADWIVDVAEQAGYRAQTTSVPGVAQRTGATIYYVELFPPSDREPVLALMPVPGEVDVVIASELMEAGRAVQRGLVTPDRTTLITSTHRVYSMTERTAPADGRVDSDTLVAAARAAARVFVTRDFARIAEDNRSVISAALLGALAATRALPFERHQFEEAIDRGGVGVASSRAAFGGGFDAASRDESTPALSRPPTSVGPRLASLAGRVRHTFPPASHEIVMAGILRLADYQDERYAAEYLDALDAIRGVDEGDCVLLNETARYLALWMSYEDAIRVADLKIRRTRFDRVQKESRAAAEQVVHINEFLHPQLAEFADIAPAPVGRWLLRSGLAKWIASKLTHKGTVLETTSVSGYVRLYIVASLRPTRRRSLRFVREHAKIAEWLARIPALAKTNYSLAVEVAQCPRLIKGYGETHERGARKFDEVMLALPDVDAPRFRALREAALADV